MIASRNCRIPYRSSSRLQLGLSLIMLLLLVGCGQQQDVGSSTQSEQAPTPTVSAAFEAVRPTMGPPTAIESMPITVPTRTSIEDEETDIERAMAEQGIRLVPVYDDVLSAGWTLGNSYQIQSDPNNTVFVFAGRRAIKASLLIGTGQLYFTVSDDSPLIYRRDKVRGLRFRLSGGRYPIDNEAMVVTVVGSNASPYWQANDRSVQLNGRVTDNGPLFSETRLFFLGIEQTIPAGEWIDVEVWLDDLIYDPEYSYVTGFYLKADREAVPTFYIDDVSLLMEDERLQQP